MRDRLAELRRAWSANAVGCAAVATVAALTVGCLAVVTFAALK